MTNEELYQMTMEELIDLNNKVVSALKNKRAYEIAQKKSQLYVTQAVNVINSKKSDPDEKFIIKKINNVKAQCLCVSTNVVWTIPISMLVPAKEV